MALHDVVTPDGHSHDPECGDSIAIHLTGAREPIDDGAGRGFDETTAVMKALAASLGCEITQSRAR